MNNHHFLFDTETTGLLKSKYAREESKPRIIEIYGRLVRAGTREIIKEVEYFVNPKVRIPKEIQKKTGITPRLMRENNAVEFGTVAKEISDILYKSDLVIAHNVMFDFRMLKHEFKLCYHNTKWFDKKMLMCTVEASEHLFGKRVTLSKMYTEFTGKNPPRGIHRAKVDVQMLHECYLTLYAKGCIE